VGRIIDTLRELNLAENTLVIFFSDNGAVGMCPQEFRHLRGGKFSHYEGGHRVPAVAWWPGRIKSGVVSSELIMGFDLFPTFVEIAGLQQNVPTNLDGLSIKKHLLEQEDVPSRDLFFGYEPKLGTAMRRGEWKMIVKDGDVQLYDLKNDLMETKNVAEEYPEISRDMSQKITRFKQEVTSGT